MELPGKQLKNDGEPLLWIHHFVSLSGFIISVLRFVLQMIGAFNVHDARRSPGGFDGHLFQQTNIRWRSSGKEEKQTAEIVVPTNLDIKL